MLTLDDALALLDEDEVDEVIVQSGQSVRALKGFTERTIPGEALTASAIVGILQAAHLQDIVPRHDTAGEEHSASIDGRDYHFRIARFLDLIELRISIGGDGPVEYEGDDAIPAAGASEETVTVTAPRGPKRAHAGGAERRSPSTGRNKHHYGGGAMPAPTRNPIGSDDPIDETAHGSSTPTRQETPAETEAASSSPALSITPPGDPAAASPGPQGSPTPTKRDTPASRLGTSSSTPAERETAAEQPPMRGGTRTDIPVARPAPVNDVAADVAAPRIYEETASRLDPAIAAIIADARSAGASDVHFVSGEPTRVRRAGRLEPNEDAPVSSGELAAAVESLLAPHHAHALAEVGYVDLGTSDPRAGRLRINVCRHRTGLKLCVRLVAAAPATPTELGLPWEVEAVANHHQGLIVCSGPSGAGKTTTMAALVNLFNERKAVHIITVEDPVEIKLGVAKSIVSQREIGTHTVSFANALKAALREDPDIIAIGELRDRETVEMALSAAETGHLVLATMSTPSGTHTISRLIDLFPPDDQSQVRATLAGALKLVVSQRLVETADGSRQVAAFEVITGNVPLWSLIRDQKLHQLPSLLQRGRAYGMVRLEDSLRGLMLSQTITRNTAVAFADDPKLLGGEEGAPPASRRARAGSR